MFSKLFISLNVKKTTNFIFMVHSPDNLMKFKNVVNYFIDARFTFNY